VLGAAARSREWRPPRLAARDAPYGGQPAARAHPPETLARASERRDEGVAASAPRSSRPFLGPGTTRYPQPRGTHGDRYWLRIHTTLEVASGPLLRSYAACLLLSGALRSAEIRSLKYHGKYHGESVPDGIYFPRSMNSAGERTCGTASASWSRWASPETMHCAPAMRASATR
jgi:hypothetical protein